ncbi:MAG: exosome complex RNA-binding protein Csl4 [Candidatus Micrarchaeia archaeon]
MVSRIVFPGECVAVSEEFAAERGTVETKDGKILSVCVGNAVLDSNKRSAGVKCAKLAERLSAGDLVYGSVQDVYDSVSLVRFQPVEENGVFKASSRTYAYLRISEIQRGYVESFRDVLKIGDYIRARVKEITPLGVYLTVMDVDLGVVRAHCSKCRAHLQERGRLFVCFACGFKETRKAARKSR